MKGEWRSLLKRVLILLLFALRYPALAQDKAAQIDALMSRYHEYRQFNGLILVAERGKVIYKKGLGLANMEWNVPNSPDTRFRLGSITKQFTAALILQLAEEGKINLQGKICDYLPDYPRKTGERITIHQLLVHTSGIPSYTGLPDFIEQKSRNPYTPGDFIKAFSNLDLEFEPGSKFSYNNSGYFLLGAIIEKITGQTYEKALAERIFKPLNMTSSGYDHHNTILEKRAGAYNRTPDGFENAPYLDMSIPYSAGSLYSTVEDLFLWDQALYTDKPVSAKYKEMMFKPNLENYGYGVFIRKEPIGQADRKVTVIGHGGGINGFNTLIERLLEDKHLIVLLNNTGGTKLGEMSQNIRKILYSEPHKEPQRPISQTLYKTILERDVESAVRQYRELKANQPEVYDFGEFELEFVGRHLLKIKKNMEAIEILKLNVEAHPKIPMVYDSLGDAYRETGNKELAIKHYAKALELDPNNRNLVGKMKNLIDR
jgi:CubicO group peptidase (beta-lactamase class C family)